MKYALFAALIMATPVAAQDRMTPEQCVGSWDALETIVGVAISDDAIEPNNEGWCEITDGVFQMDPSTRIRISSLRWRASDIERLIELQLLPRSIEIQGQGFGVVPETGDPLYDYLLGIQMTQPETAFGLTVRWDGVQNTVIIDDTFLNFSALNRIEVSARIEGANLTDQATTQTSFGTMGLRELNIESDFAGWFEAYVAFALGAAVLTDGEVSPEDQVAEIKQHVIDFISEIPDANMPEASRNAVSAFVMSLPSPRGRAQLQLNATPVLGAARMTPFAVSATRPTPAQVLELGLEGVTFRFTWVPTGEAQ